MSDGTGTTAEALLAHAGWMRCLALSLVRDTDRADDVVQESWVAALERPPRHSGNVTAWLGRVITNRARQSGRTEGRRKRREVASARAEALPSTQELVLEAELQREVVSAILKLGEPYLSTVLLRFYRDLTPKEIAARQGIPAATVRTRLKRALGELRCDLDRRYGGDRSAWSTALLPFARGAALVFLSVTAKLAVGAVGIALLAALVSNLRILPAPVPTPTAPGPVVAADTREEVESLSSTEEAEIAEASTAEVGRVALVSVPASPSTRAFHGKVSDPAGEPIAKATLRVFAVRVEGGWAKHSVAGGETDAEGQFRIPVPDGLDTSRDLLIEAEAVGYESMSVDPVVLEEAPFLITLNWTTEIFGHVLDAETGAPIADARVSHWQSVTPTAADGSYRLSTIPVAEEINLAVVRDGYASTLDSTAARSRDPHEHTIHLRRGEPMLLTVFAVDTGMPLAGAAVFRNGKYGLGETDEAGQLVVRVLEGEELRLAVKSEGYADSFWSFDVHDASALAAPRIPMRGLGWIEGTLHDEAGEPLSGCRLHAGKDELRMPKEEQKELGLPGSVWHKVPRDIISPIKRASGSTDDEGRFTIAVLPSPDPFRVTGGSREHVAVDAGPVHLTEAGQRAWVEITQRKGATIRGRVLRNGEPWTRATVLTELEGGPGPTARVDDEGDYLLRAVPAGEVTLRLREFTNRSTRAEPVELVVEAGEEYERDISWEEDLAEIRGFVVETNGDPVAGLRVSAVRFDSEGQYRSTSRGETAADGSFTIDVATDGVYTVKVSRPPASDSREDVLPGTKGIRLVLPDVGRVRFRLVDAATGEAVHPSRFDFRNLGWREIGAEEFRSARNPRTVDGVLELDIPFRSDVTKVDLCFYMNEDGYRPQHSFGLPVARAGETPPVVEVELERGVDCRVKLVGDEPLVLERRHDHLFFLLRADQLALVRGPFPTGGGPANSRVHRVHMWFGELGLLHQRLDFDDAGFAGVQGLEPGRYTLEVFPDDYTFEPATLELPTDTTPVEIRWRAR